MAPPEPDLRILQANERTLLAWVRTGLSLMAFGFVISRLAAWLRLEHPDESASPWLGVLVIVLGMACNALGAHRFVQARRAIVEHRAIAPGATGPVVLAYAVVALGLGAIAYVLVIG